MKCTRMISVRGTRDKAKLSWFSLWCFLVAMLVAFAGYSTNYSIEWPDFGAGDFLAYWSVPRALLYAEVMYDQTWLAAVQQSLGFDGYTFLEATYDVAPLWNPPPIVLLLLPLAPLDFTLATLLWITLSLTLYGHAVLLFNLALPTSLSPPMALWLAFLFIPATIAAYWGQPNLILTACVVYAWFAQRQNRPAAVGILLVPLLLKPHLFGATLVLFVVIAVRRRHWETIGLFVAGVASLTIVLIALDSNWLRGWLSQGLSRADTLAWPDLLAGWIGAPAWLPPLAYPISGLFAVVRYRRTRVLDAYTLAEVSFISFLLSPYTFSHDLVVIMPTIMWACGQLWGRTWRVFIPFVAFLWWISPIYMTGLLRPFDHIATPWGMLGELEILFRFYSLLLAVFVIWYAAVRKESRISKRWAKQLL